MKVQDVKNALLSHLVLGHRPRVIRIISMLHIFKQKQVVITYINNVKSLTNVVKTNFLCENEALFSNDSNHPDILNNNKMKIKKRRLYRILLTRG